MLTHDEKMKMLVDDNYPLSAKYDPNWMYENRNGCQCLWLVESLSQILPLKPGMKVLDIGCGNALTSIFLAKEYGVTVFAADMIDPSGNLKRIEEAGVENLVIPIRGEAHRLPFSDHFFDIIISINSFQFFGTADNYLSDHMAHLLKPDGWFGLVVFGPDKEFNGKVPEFLEDSWWPDFYYFHSLDWWKWHFEKTKLFDFSQDDDMDGDGVRITHLWSKIMNHFDDSPTKYIMRWNRLVFKRNDLMPDDLRTAKHI